MVTLLTQMLYIQLYLKPRGRILRFTYAARNQHVWIHRPSLWAILYTPCKSFALTTPNQFYCQCCVVCPFSDTHASDQIYPWRYNNEPIVAPHPTMTKWRWRVDLIDQASGVGHGRCDAIVAGYGPIKSRFQTDQTWKSWGSTRTGNGSQTNFEQSHNIVRGRQTDMTRQCQLQSTTQCLSIDQRCHHWLFKIITIILIRLMFGVTFQKYKHLITSFNCSSGTH